jgi:hypothetical protein
MRFVQLRIFYTSTRDIATPFGYGALVQVTGAKPMRSRWLGAQV